ncbi:Short-chain alcohol dehydrogenase [Pyrenophora teres f. maculata]|nr:Short-chain alcohol dehydrogenase [Pyrenophora teres f. maculata]
MSSDDQQFLGVLAEYSKDVRTFTGSIWDATDAHFAHVAGYIKKNLPEGWLPERARPRPPPPSSHPITGTYLHRIQHWVSENRALTAAIVAFFGTGGLLVWRERRNYNRKRRARKASNGARTEVVVLAGPPNSPVVRSLSLDLERRGFIVYIVCSSMDEEQQVLSESRVDVRPLHLDVVDTMGTQDAIDRFNALLAKPHVAFSGATPHNLHLSGVILVPDLIYPTGPVETVTPELWSDALNAKVLNTIAVTQALLPTVCEFKSRVLMLTPSIIAALRPPFHSVESTIVSALEGFLASLRAELGTLGIEVLQFHLGTFDFTNVGLKQHLPTRWIASPVAWPATTRALYASNFEAQTRVAQNRGLLSQSGSSLRELHNGVFDALTQKRPRKVWRVGRGSVTYDVVGKWVPSGVVGWMMGLQRVSLDKASKPKLEDSVQLQAWERIDAMA